MFVSLLSSYTASREDILRNLHAKNISPYTDQTKSYKPDLRYLSKGSVNDSLASRLAHQLQPSQTSSEPIPPSSDSSDIAERPVDHTIAQRRAARLAREDAAARRQSAERPGASSPDPSTETGRRPEARQDTHGAVHARTGHGNQQFRRDNSGRPDKARPEWNSTSRGSRGVGNRRGAFRGTFAPRRERTAQTGEETSNEDISLETLEEGGDEKELAEFQDPDATFADLDHVFGRVASISRSRNVLCRQAKQLADPPTLHEGSGSSYTRFAPHGNFLISHDKMSPMKHIEFVLSKRDDVTITSRYRALDIVESSIGQAGTSKAQRI